ncbi:MAG TPA: DUF5693 family protein [Anaerolineae bacterium]|nr:DUF5693 family protein [Anaerolineae bacterium]
MKLSRLLSLSLTVAGSIAAARFLARRRQWEHAHTRVAICVDYDDAYAASIRAGLPFHDLLHQLADHGATHVSLPELTLNRLLASGHLAPQAPTSPRTAAPRIGHWNYLHGPSQLLTPLAAELTTRLPYTEAKVSAGSTLIFAGDLPTIGEIGLGFDTANAERILAHGLGVVPRPVSYAWPEQRLLDRTLAQAAALGRLIAFDGELILGHEMHLDETLAAMEREGLALVYFAESRHQKGDWFIAKRRAPHVVLAHRFTPQDLIPLDFHAAAHHWAYLARERGIRLCYVNFFKVLHATEPLEGLHYVEHIKEALEHDGFQVTPDVCLPAPAPAPTKQELALTGLAPAGIVAAAANALLDPPEVIAIPLVAAAAGGAAMLPFLERARGHLEEQYPPSYAPKALALMAAALAPAAAAQLIRSKRDGLEGWATGLVLEAAAATSLAALTSGQDYHLRIEEYRGFNLDWLLPLLSAARSIPNRVLRTGTLAALGGAWIAANQRRLDPLARLDPAHAEGHTHHLSAAARLIGDAKLRLGLQPARKWAGLGPLGAALNLALASRGHKDWAAVASFAGAIGNTLGLVGFRRPERALDVTAREALPSFGAGAALSLFVLLSVKRNHGWH